MNQPNNYMKKYCSSLTFGGLGIAFLTLALGLVSCHPEKTEKKTADGNDVIPTENLLWEETKSTTEGCKISATYPTDTTTALTRNIREWINEELGGTYAGDLNEGPKMIEYYGKAHADQIKRDIAEWGENTSMDK
ncbi:MAG: DUF3298 domain-containing protein, partial [Paraprevotella sp.]|nr:DUF3298 domain-containing protein [Paraprevotella sp.]